MGDNMKKILWLILLIPLNVFAYSPYIYASGKNVGIALKSKGISIVGLYKVGNAYPGSDAGLEVGDVITSIDDFKVSNIDDMVSYINSITNDTIKIGYIRNNISKYTNLKLVKENMIYKTGLYVKDSISGIGTLTYIDPKTHIFGALGHEITDGNIALEIKDGSIYESVVTGIDRGSNGIAGSKNAKYDTNNKLGDVYENTIHGIFGKYRNTIDNNKLYKVATPKDIKKGNAKILTVLSGDEIKEYDINITKLNKIGSTKNILFEITDKELLEKTGGIIQGMSGSPIIQDDYIIGAVTHVILSTPNKGYGIFITNMLEEGEN